MANARDGQVWLTIQVHENIVAVALLTNVVGVIITGGGGPCQRLWSEPGKKVL